jgi:putative ABC transport system permease protein
LNDIPEVKSAVRIKLLNEAVLKNEEFESKENQIFFTDPSFFNVFTIRIIKGNPAENFDEPFNILLSRSAGEKYFAKQDPLGKTIVLNNSYSFKVAGIFDDIESNTSIKTDFIASYKSIERIQPVDQWGSFGEDHTYLLINPDANINDLQKKIQQILVKNTNEQFAQMFNIIVIPFNEIYFRSELMGDLGKKGNKDYVNLFSVISFLVLIIACLNFINLSTAKSIRRAAEVGVRKVLGANRANLIKQFFVETLLVTLIAAGISLILFEFLSPLLASYLNTQLNMIHQKSAQFYLIFISTILFVGIAAGAYPAFYLSRFALISAIGFKGYSEKTGMGFRKGLVVFQFGITMVLIFCTLIIKEQIDFMRKGELGFEKENILIINLPAKNPNAEIQYETFRNNLLKLETIIDVAAAYSFPGINSHEQQTVKTPGMAENENVIMRSIGVDYDYINTLGLKLLKGRNFSKTFSTDKNEAVVLNENAVDKLGLKDPIGKELMIPGGNGGFKRVKIVGVVKDFHLQSMHEPISPLFLYINPDRFFHAAVKFQNENQEEIIKNIQAEYAVIFPAEQFNYNFLDDLYSGLYLSEEKINSLFMFFSFFAVFIACLGLSGLSAYSAEQRTKEIGIRKILGATGVSIITMLSKNYLKLIIISSLIAFPAAYFIAENWLNDFAYRITIGVVPFVAAFLVSFIIAFATILSHLLKAVRANPVKSLKWE